MLIERKLEGTKLLNKFLALPLAVREQMEIDYLRHVRASDKAGLRPDVLWLPEVISDAERAQASLRRERMAQLNDIKTAKRAEWLKEEFVPDTLAAKYGKNRKYPDTPRRAWEREYRRKK